MTGSNYNQTINQPNNMSPETNPHDLAHPLIEEGKNGDLSISLGLTKREHFAAMAMQGLAATSAAEHCPTSDQLADMAVRYADSLIASLNES